MNQVMVTTIKDGVLTLPAPLRQPWRDRQVVLFVEKNRFIVQNRDAAWPQYEEKIKKGRKKISPALIREAVNWAKTQS